MWIRLCKWVCLWCCGGRSVGGGGSGVGKGLLPRDIPSHPCTTWWVCFWNLQTQVSFKYWGKILPVHISFFSFLYFPLSYLFCFFCAAFSSGEADYSQFGFATLSNTLVSTFIPCLHVLGSLLRFLPHVNSRTVCSIRFAVLSPTNISVWLSCDFGFHAVSSCLSSSFCFFKSMEQIYLKMFFCFLQQIYFRESFPFKSWGIVPPL